MLRGLIGLPGNGKTMTCVSKMVDEWLYTDRCVGVNPTDGELKLGRLNEYLCELCAKRGIDDKVIDLENRLVIIPKEHSFQFYRYRAGGLILPEPPDTKMPLKEWYVEMKKYFLPMLEKPEYMVPMSYFIFEAHDFFPAKDWQEIGRPTKFYASKHRHLHDEVILETQFPEQLEPNFRKLVQEWHRMTNNYLRSFGPFAKRGCFVREAFHSLPSGNAVPYEKAEFKLDAAGIASCYETTGSLGLMQRGPESKGFDHKRRLPWWSIWVGAAVASIASFFILRNIPQLIGRGVNSMVSGVSSGMSGGVLKPASAVVPSKAVHAVASPRSDSLLTPAPSPESDFVRISGVMTRGSTVYVSVPGIGWLQCVGRVGADGIALSDGTVCRRVDVVNGPPTDRTGKKEVVNLGL